jgi:hypothetical protein
MQLNEYDTAPYFIQLSKPKLDIRLFVDFCVFTNFWSKLRLGAQNVTLLSTLRDPTQLRQCQCACYAMFEWKKL